MTDNSAAVAIALIKFAWAALCLGTCAYAVFWLGHSGWWFLLAILLAATSDRADKAARPGPDGAGS